MTSASFGRIDRTSRFDQLPQGNHKAQGVVLRRKEGSGKSQELLLFLKGMGTAWVGAPGADGSKNRFGAGTEPMMWGTFNLYQSPRRLYLKAVDVREDFWNIRKSPRALATSIRWCGSIASRLPPGYENDSLLSLLWGSMGHLASGCNHLLLDVRFAWRWGNLWGTAPSLEACCNCGRDLEDGSASLLRPSSDGFLCGVCSGEAGAGADLSFHDAVTIPVLHVVHHAAMLPRERFFAWAQDRTIDCAEALTRCSAWLYSFL